MSAREQSTGLSEISSAINQMDGATRKNAGIIEGTAAAVHGLVEQANILTNLAATFKRSRSEPVGTRMAS